MNPAQDPKLPTDAGAENPNSAPATESVGHLTPGTADLTNWLQALAAGDEQAQGELWAAYYDKLVRYAQRKLEASPLRTADEEDVALSALYSFYRGVAAGRFPDLEDESSLWRLLLTITARKASRRRRAETTQSRGRGQVRGESYFAVTDSDSQRAGIQQVPDGEPTPDLVNIVAENCRLLIGALENTQLQTIALMKLEGYTNREIAEHFDVIERTIERKLQRIRQAWSRHQLLGEAD